MSDKTVYDDGREFDVGDKIGNHEVTAVSYQERYDEDGNAEKHSFVYHVEHPDQVRQREQEAADAEKAQREQEAAAKQGALLGGVDGPQETEQ